MEQNQFNCLIKFFGFLLLTCGGELGFFSTDVDASRIGLILDSIKDVLGVGKLQKRKLKFFLHQFVSLTYSELLYLAASVLIISE